MLDLHGEGLSYRLIARNVGLSKNTVMGIVRREAADQGEYRLPNPDVALCYTRPNGLRGIWDTIRGAFK